MRNAFLFFSFFLKKELGEQTTYSIEFPFIFPYITERGKSCTTCVNLDYTVE